MPINKHALIRYKVIDNCLQNRYRRWTLENLVDACSDALQEYEGIDKGVSLRTIQLDIQNMRSEKLGYNAPIVVIDKKYYTYEDKTYSITNIPLTGQDLEKLSEVVTILKQFKGFSHFRELTSMVNRLEDKVYTQRNEGRSIISFEKNEQLKGLEYLDAVYKAIAAKTPLEIGYQSFKARVPGVVVFHPYLLKEYRNRWFVLGVNENRKPQLMTVALDRITSLRLAEGTKYIENTIIDVDTFFDNALGVTKNPGQMPNHIVLLANNEMAPYIKTKPIHASQCVLRQDKEGMTFSIDVIWNFELEREILGFGESLKVLAPRILAKRITNRIEKMAELYRQIPEEATPNEAKPGA